MNRITPPFALKPFIDNIDDEINKAIRIFENILFNSSINSEYFSSPELSSDKNSARYILLNVRLKFIYVLESLGLHKMLEEFQNEFLKHEMKITNYDLTEEHDLIYNEIISLFFKYRDIISIQLDSELKNEELSFLNIERILKALPTILSMRNVIPCCEGDIQMELYMNCRYIFPFTIKEFKTPKVVKNYIPDVGIKNLECAIEVKFACSVDEVKTAVEGINADMQNYSGSKDWTKFYGLIYMSDSFYTDEQIATEFEISKIQKNWQIFTVVGRGDRTLKKSKSKP